MNDMRYRVGMGQEVLKVGSICDELSPTVLYSFIYTHTLNKEQGYKFIAETFISIQCDMDLSTRVKCSW